jgi:hypothetical protein
VTLSDGHNPQVVRKRQASAACRSQRLAGHDELSLINYDRSNIATAFGGQALGEWWEGATMQIHTRDFLESWWRAETSGLAYYHSNPRCSATPGQPHLLWLTNPPRDLPTSVIRIEYRYKPSDNGSSDHSSTSDGRQSSWLVPRWFTETSILLKFQGILQGPF